MATTSYGGVGSGGSVSASSIYIDVTASPYNADKTGATDTVLAIQAAVEAVEIAGGTLYFPIGTYQISAKIQAIDEGSTWVHIKGEHGATIHSTDPNSAGIAIRRNNTKLSGMLFTNVATSRLATDSAQTVLIGKSTFRAENIEISNVTVDGGASAGILCRRGRDLTIYKCMVKNNYADGYHIFNTDGYLIDSCVAQDTGDDTFAILTGKSETVFSSGNVVNCRSERSGSRGFIVVGGKGNNFVGCVCVESDHGAFMSYTDPSVSLGSCYDTTFTSCIAIDTSKNNTGSSYATFSAVAADSVEEIENTSFINCISRNTNNDYFRVTGAVTKNVKNTKVVGCTFSGTMTNARSGISLQEATNVDIINTTIENAENYGIFVDTTCDGIMHIDHNTVIAPNQGNQSFIDGMLISLDGVVFITNNYIDVSGSPSIERPIEANGSTVKGICTGNICSDGTKEILEPQSSSVDFPRYILADISDVGHLVNTGNVKRSGSVIIDATNNKLKHSTGRAANSTWVDSDGTNAVTPV